MSRAVSPFTVRRVEEKVELHGLNQRLETYVAHSKTLVQQRDRLMAQLEESEAIHAAEKEEMVSRHDTLVKSIRAELSTTRTVLAKAEASAARYQREMEAMKAKMVQFTAIKKERDELKSLVPALEEENADLKAQLRALTAEFEEVTVKYGVLQRQEAELQDRLNATSAEAAELSKQIGTSSGRYKLEMKKMKESVAASIQAARDEWDAIAAAKAEQLERDLKLAHEKEVADLKKRADQLALQCGRLQEEARDALSEAQAARSQVMELQVKVREQESAISTSGSGSREKIQRLEESITSLRMSLASKQDEFHELMDVKVSLEAEIAHYRRILEAEETRFGLSDSETDAPKVTVEKVTKKKLTKKSSKKKASKKTTRAEAEGAGAGAGAGAGGKRGGTKKRKVMTRTLTKSTAKFSTSGVDMVLDLIADTVKITNNTGEPLAMKGWVLESEVGTQSFKFPEDLVLEPDASVTVWSGKNAQRHHKPPHHLFWTKRYIWNNDGDSAVVRNAEGDIVQEVTGEPVDAEEAKEVVLERKASWWSMFG